MMKGVFLRKKILDAILLAERIVGKKESLPVLSCVLLDVRKNDITVRATNLEAGIEILVGGEIEHSGVVAVNPAILIQTLRSLSGEKITLSQEEGNLLVESRGSKTLIKAVPHEEFPAISVGENPHTDGAVSRELFLQGIRAVLYAASQSMIRPELGSVFLSLKAVGFTAVATDSFRLAEKTLAKAARNDVGDILIPLKHAMELVHVLEHMADPEVYVRADDSQVVVWGGGAQFVSRIVDATFPNYRDIIPKIATTEVTLLKSDFNDMLKKARVFSGTEQSVGLHVYPARKTMSATARSAEVGEMSDVLEGALSGEDLDINFHIGYLGDCLTSIHSDSLTLSFAGPQRPLIIRGVGDASFMYLAMPLNR